MTVARNSLVSGLPEEGRRLDLVFDPVYIEIAVARVERAEVVRELSEWSPGALRMSTGSSHASTRSSPSSDAPRSRGRRRRS
jgi:hypothetical protein